MAEKKILILGAAGFPVGVQAYAWDRLPPELNVADFDVVILNLAVFESDAALRDGINPERLPERDGFTKLIFSNSEVIAIGALDTQLGGDRETVILGGVPALSKTYADWWLPIGLEVIREKGGVRACHYDWREYHDELVKTFSRYYDHPPTGPVTRHADLRAVHPEASGLVVESEVLSTTRFDKAVGLRLRFVAYDEGGRYEPTALKASGDVFLLPTPTECAPEEAIDAILATRFGVAAESREPDWIGNFLLPAEQGPRERSARELEVAREAFERHQAAEAELAEERRFRKLLYETGEDVLEPVVRDALRVLGAEVEDPKVKGREDGRLTYTGDKRGMLEIKGRKSVLKLADVRELDQWVRDALIEWESKGLLIACLRNEESPEARTGLFPDNAAKFAARAGICLMTTTQLYEALRRDQLGELDRDAFFATIFETDGACKLPEPEAGEPPLSQGD